MKKSKKMIDTKNKRFSVVRMEDQGEVYKYASRFEPDFAQKLEAIRKRYGSLAKFLKLQKSRGSMRDTEESLLGKRRSVSTT